MKVLNKTEQIAHSQGRRSLDAIQEMLMGYRSTPHPATDYSPYEALMKRKVRTKLDTDVKDPEVPKMEKEITASDKRYKDKWFCNERRQKAGHHSINVGDKVLLSQKKKNKWTTSYKEEMYIVFQVDGSSIGARRCSDGREVYRDVTRFKRLRGSGRHTSDNWRERYLQRYRGPTTFQCRETRDQSRDVNTGTGVSRPRRTIRKPARYTDY